MASPLSPGNGNDFELVVYPGALEAVVFAKQEARTTRGSMEARGDGGRRAAARARRKVRLYGVANLLTRLLTLNIADRDVRASPGRALIAVKRFLRRAEVPLDSGYPFVGVFERSDPVGVHFHALLPAVGLDDVLDLWGDHGDARVDELAGIEEIRRAAGYMSKTFDGVPPVGSHRYRLRRAYIPKPLVYGGFRSIQSAISAACDLIGCEPERIRPIGPAEHLPAGASILWSGDDAGLGRAT
jgi:hypothetical protein